MKAAVYIILTGNLFFNSIIFFKKEVKVLRLLCGTDKDDIEPVINSGVLKFVDCECRF